MLELMNYTHHIPGRIRMQSVVLKHNSSSATELQQWLESVKGVRSVQINAVTGSVLIHYSVGAANGDTLLAQLRDRGWITAGRQPAPIPQHAIAEALLKSAARIVLERSVLALAAALL